MKWVVLVVVLGALAGGGLWLHQRPDQMKKVTDEVNDVKAHPQQAEDDAKKAALKAEIELTNKKLYYLNLYLKACRDHKPPEHQWEGYDAFSYQKEGDYKVQQEEQEQRLKDLQARLNTEYKMN